MTTVPENWTPFVPVHVDGDNREIQLQRAALPRILEGDPNPPVKVQPRTMLLRQGLDQAPPQPYLVHEEEISRAGTRLTQAYQRTRAPDGRVYTWLRVRRQTGRGEGSSGLAFDQIPPCAARQLTSGSETLGGSAPRHCVPGSAPVFRVTQLARRLTAAEQEGGSSVIAQWRHHQLRDTSAERCLH
jgi:hypothetical protein